MFLTAVDTRRRRIIGAYCVRAVKLPWRRRFAELAMISLYVSELIGQGGNVSRASVILKQGMFLLRKLINKCFGKRFRIMNSTGNSVIFLQVRIARDLNEKQKRTKGKIRGAKFFNQNILKGRGILQAYKLLSRGSAVTTMDDGIMGIICRILKK